MALKIKHVQNVPLERFERTTFRKLYKGKRSWSLPLGNLSVSSPLSPILTARSISPLASGDSGTPSLRTLPKGAPLPLETQCLVQQLLYRSQFKKSSAPDRYQRPHSACRREIYGISHNWQRYVLHFPRSRRPSNSRRI